jgi:hypothetical protein
MANQNFRDILLVEAQKPFPALLLPVEHGREALLANLEGVTEHQARYKPLGEAQTSGDPAEDSWSIEEVMRHLIFACAGAAERIAELAAGRPAEGVSAPGILGGNEDANLRTLIERYNEAHDRLEAVLRSLRGQEYLEPTAPHPAFGDLNCRAWAALYGRHLASHARQVADIKASPDFPART